VEPELRNTTLDGRVVLPWGGDSNTLTAGAQFSRQRLSGVAAQDAVPTGYARNADLLQRDAWALFAENDYAMTPAFTLTTGARLDHDELYGSRVSPRVYGVYALDDQWTLRGGVATGFKAPTLRQSTGGYCMTTGGAAGATPGTLCGNPELKPETSVAQEIGVRRDAGADFASATLFNNAFKNKVASYDTGVADPASPGRNVYIYDNIARVRLRGLELAAGSDVSPVLRLTGNYTYTDSRRRGSGGENAFNGSSLDGRPLDKTPKHKLYLEASWKALPGLDLYTAAQYTSRQYWAAFRNGALGVRERAGATTFDLGARYVLARGVDLKVALLNLSNKMVPVDERSRTGGLSGNWMVDEGRRLNVALNAQF
jgi:outer membrane receptor for ferrienterochelin and colicins